MNFWAAHFPPTILWAAWAALLPLLAFALVRAYKNPPHSGSLILGMMIFTVLWSLHASLNAGEQAGMVFHLLGTTLITLILGFPAALCLFGFMSILYILLFQGIGNLPVLALNIVAVGLPAILITHTLLYLARRFLPRQLFIFIFINAFFAGALSMMGVGVLIVLLLSFIGHYDSHVLWEKTFPVFFLLSWAEAFFSGLLTAVFISFAPRFLHEFNDEIYLPKRPSHF